MAAGTETGSSALTAMNGSCGPVALVIDAESAPAFASTGFKNARQESGSTVNALPYETRSPTAEPVSSSTLPGPKSGFAGCPGGNASAIEPRRARSTLRAAAAGGGDDDAGDGGCSLVDGEHPVEATTTEASNARTASARIARTNSA
jgi:hypothetical protein